MFSTSAYPCTGITFKSTDGGVVARTVEWALNDVTCSCKIFWNAQQHPKVK
jgi:penicillin V acylase-like amidase (Ntn superfamily)